MRARFPLSMQFAAWLVLNLTLLAVGGALLLRAQFSHGFNSLLAASAGSRVETLAGSVVGQIRGEPKAKWDATLKTLSATHGVPISIYRNSGEWVAGARHELPAEVRQAMDRRDPARAELDRRGPPARRGPPGGPRDFGPPEDGPPPPRAEPAPDARDSTNWSKFLLRTTSPTAYWLGIRAPLDNARPPNPLTLLIRTDSIAQGGLLLDARPIYLAGIGAVIVSVLFWLPFVHRLTRQLRRVTAATAEVARGKFDVRLPAHDRDELGGLSTAVNAMAGQLDTLVTGQKRFLGDVAHELCSPLARMQAALAILEQRATDAKQARYLANLREELDSMSQLLDELLQFTKAGVQREIALRPVPLAPLVQEVVAREGRGTEVICDVPQDLVAQAEPALLARALGNLLRNAVRYAGDAGAIVISGAARNGEVEITVADQGPGVSPESLPRLFDAFYRPDDARTRESGGTGLGLAIVKTCVQACRGRIFAANQTGRGFAVTLTFSRVEPAPVPALPSGA